jgi:hypothetical protein
MQIRFRTITYSKNYLKFKNMNNIKINTKTNLIGQAGHKKFLEIQALYGFAQRGGTVISSEEHAKRISSDVNFLNSSEKKSLIFNETIFNN